MSLNRYFPKLAGLEHDQIKAQNANKRLSRAAAAKQERDIADKLKDPKKLRAAILNRLNESMDGGFKKDRPGRRGEDDNGLTDE